jgi:hypothetical protein
LAEKSTFRIVPERDNIEMSWWKLEISQRNWLWPVIK